MFIRTWRCMAWDGLHVCNIGQYVHAIVLGLQTQKRQPCQWAVKGPVGYLLQTQAKMHQLTCSRYSVTYLSTPCPCLGSAYLRKGPPLSLAGVDTHMDVLRRLNARHGLTMDRRPERRYVLRAYGHSLRLCADRMGDGVRWVRISNPKGNQGPMQDMHVCRRGIPLFPVGRAIASHPSTHHHGSLRTDSLASGFWGAKAPLGTDSSGY